MPNPNLILLYVRDSAKSADFYQDLLGRKPAATFPTFVSFSLNGGFTLGLWSMQTVNPAPSETGSRSELAFMVEDNDAVDALYADWRKRGLTIALELTTAVFGRTFVALDPDGHRLRVCTPDK